jgi:two-component system cell cycle response regulator
MDSLTSLYNNTYFKQFLELEIKRCSREKHPLSLLIINIDGLITSNSTFGQGYIDETLKEIASIIKSTVREIDLPARYGDNVFAIIFPYTHIDGALHAAERIQTKLKSAHITVDGEKKPIEVNTSMGLSTFPGSADTVIELINVADDMLHRAKKNGKNRIEMHRSGHDSGMLKIVAS